MFDRFTDHARKAMGYARQESQRLCHDYIGTEHMLVGVAQVSNSTAATVLSSEDVDLARIRAQVGELVPHGTTMATMNQIPFTPSGKKALELSLEASLGLGDDYIGTAHLLLGLIGEDGVAARVLDELGVNRDRVSEGLGADAWQSPVRLRCDEVARLKAEIEDLRRRNDALQERIDRLESER